MDYEAILGELLYSENSEELFQKYKESKDIMKLYLPLRSEKYTDTPIEIRKNVEICIEILKNNPLFFKNLESDMRSNQEVIKVAVDLHSANYKYIISTDFAWKRNLLLKMLNKEYVSSVQAVSYNLDRKDFEIDFYDDKEVILAWLKHSTSILDCIDKKYLNDIDVANVAVGTYGLSIFVFSKDILNNKNCVLRAVKSTPIVYEKLSDDNPLKNDDDIKKAYNDSIVKININDILKYMDSEVKESYDYGVKMDMPYIIEKSYTADIKEQICSIINAMLLFENPVVFQTAISKYRTLMNSFEFVSSDIMGVKTKKIIKYCNIDSIFEYIKNDESIEITEIESEIIEKLKKLLSSKMVLNEDEQIEKVINTIKKLK